MTEYVRTTFVIHAAALEIIVASDLYLKLSVAVDIEDLSKAAACVVDWTGHGMTSGCKVTMSGITQAEWTALNAEHVITYIGANSFSIPVNTSAYAAVYVPGTDDGLICTAPSSYSIPAHFTEASGGGYAHIPLKGKGAKTAVQIEGLTRAAACVVTWTGHGLDTGNNITFAAITQTDWTALIAEHAITYINADSFSIPVNTSGYAGDYVPGTDPGTIQDTTATAWTAEANDPRDVIAAEQTYAFSGILTSDATICNWYLITRDLATIKSAKRLDTPYKPASGGGSLKFTPRIQEGNGIPV